MSETKPKETKAQKASADQSATVVTTQTEAAISMAKAAFEEVANTSRDAMERALKTVDTITGMSRGNVDALLQSSRVASGGLQDIAREVSNFSRNNFDKTLAAAQELTHAKTSPELMNLQSEFAKAQFTSAIDEISSLAESMFKIMSDIFEPLQRQALIAAQIKDLMAEE